MTINLIFAAGALVAVCCVVVDRSASWLERLGAVVGGLAMLDGSQPIGSRVPVIVPVGLLVLLALAGGVRLRFVSVSDSRKLVALHRTLGLLAIATVLGAESQSTATPSMTMGAADLGSAAMIAAYLAAGVGMAVMSIRDRRSKPDRRGRFHVATAIEAVFMAAMLIAMVAPSAPV